MLARLENRLPSIPVAGHKTYQEVTSVDCTC